MQEILTAQDLAHFEQWGWVRVSNALPADVTQGVHDFVWARLEAMGARRDDRSTWGESWVGINKKEIDRAVPGRLSERLEGAVNQLLGENAWGKSSKLGGLLFSFPSGTADEWGVTPKMWHVDNDPRAYLDAMGELMLFTFFSSVRPRGGGTLVLGGSHHLFRRFFAEVALNNTGQGASWLADGLAKWHPTLAELFGTKPSSNRSPAKWLGHAFDVHGVEIEVVELTGEPGDAVLCHPALMHAISLNCGEGPRIMRRTNFRRIQTGASFSGEQSEAASATAQPPH